MAERKARLEGDGRNRRGGVTNGRLAEDFLGKSHFDMHWAHSLPVKTTTI